MIRVFLIYCDRLIDCGFLISKWQGTASSSQGLGPAWPALSYATGVMATFEPQKYVICKILALRYGILKNVIGIDSIP